MALNNSNSIDKDWYLIKKITPYLYLIQENFEKIDSHYYTSFTNMYLIIGSHTALLFDTGTGIVNLRPYIKPIIKHHELIVINSHNHFDHVGGNYFFEETMIHRLDFKKLTKNMDLRFLSSSNSIVKNYLEKINYELSFANSMVPLNGDEVFDLGGLKVNVIYTPGHTPGSICLYLDTGEIFTGDTFQLGAIFLPSTEIVNDYIVSLNKILNIATKFPNPKLYPGHEKIGLSINYIRELINTINLIETKTPVIDNHIISKIYDFTDFKLIFSME